MRTTEIIKRQSEIIATNVDALEQRLSATDGSGYYPQGFSDSEFNRIRANSKLGDYFVAVRRDPNNRLVGIDYREAYPAEIAGIARGYRGIAEATLDESLREQALKTAEVLTDSNRPMQEIHAATMGNAGGKLLPHLASEEYDDTDYKTKAKFLFWLSRIDTGETQKWQRYVQRGMDVYNNRFQTPEVPKVAVRVGDALVTSEMFRRNHWSANTQANYWPWVRDYGAVITVMNNVFEGNAGRLSGYIQRDVHQDTIGELTSDQLKDGAKRLLLLHELGHPLVVMSAGEQHLKDLNMVYRELTPTVLGLVLAADFDRDHIKAMMIDAAGWALRDYYVDGTQDDYTRGEVALMGYWLHRNVADIHEGKFHFDFDAPITRTIQATADFLALLKEPMDGNYKRAREILGTYGPMGTDAINEIARLNGRIGNS